MLLKGEVPDLASRMLQNHWEIVHELRTARSGRTNGELSVSLVAGSNRCAPRNSYRLRARVH